MIRKVAVLSLILIFMVIIPVGAKESPYSIEANNLVLDRAENMVRAKGKVKVDFKDTTIIADELEIDMETKDVLAIGNVILIKKKEAKKNERLNGERLTYNYESKKGELLKAKGTMGKKKFAGQEIKIVDDDLKLKRAKLTSCKNPEAHYELIAREATIYPGEELIAKDVEVWLGGYHVMTYPRYRTSLKTNDLTPLPSFGYNTDDGFYMQFNYQHYVNSKLEGDIRLKATSKATDEVALDYKYDLTDDLKLSPMLTYDRAEGWDSRLKLNGTTGSLLDETKVNWQLESGYGHNEDGGQEANRSDVRLRLWKNNYRLTPTTRLGLGTDIRKADYSSGEEYKTYEFNFDLNKQSPVLADLRFDFDYVKDIGQPPGPYDFEDLDEDKDGDYEGWRHYYRLIFNGHPFRLSDKQIFDWQVRGHQFNYENGDKYKYYDYNGIYKYSLTNTTTARLGYDYREVSGEAPLRDDRVGTKENMVLGLGYRNRFDQGAHLNITGDLKYGLDDQQYDSIRVKLEYRTPTKNNAYWQISSDLDYDLINNELIDESGKTQHLAVKRVYDCMEVGVSVDFIEETGELIFNLKY